MLMMATLKTLPSCCALAVALALFDCDDDDDDDDDCGGGALSDCAFALALSDCAFAFALALTERNPCQCRTC